MNEHLNEHPHALVNRVTGVVENVFTMKDHDPEVIAAVQAAHTGDTIVVSACEHGTAYQGGTWDGTRFFPPKPYESWVWENETGWQPPVPMPTDGAIYFWDEPSLSWLVFEPPAE